MIICDVKYRAQPVRGPIQNRVQLAELSLLIIGQSHPVVPVLLAVALERVENILSRFCQIVNQNFDNHNFDFWPKESMLTKILICISIFDQYFIFSETFSIKTFDFGAKCWYWPTFRFDQNSDLGKTFYFDQNFDVDKFFYFDRDFDFWLNILLWSKFRCLAKKFILSKL